MANITGDDNFFINGSVGRNVQGLLTPGTGKSSVIVGITTIEVGPSLDSLTAIQIDNTQFQPVVRTQSGSVENVMAQVVGKVDIQNAKCDMYLNMNVYVKGMIGKTLQSTYNYDSSRENTDFILKISGATSDQMLAGDPSTPSPVFMINSDDFAAFSIRYGDFAQMSRRLKEKTDEFSLLPLKSGFATPKSFKIGFCKDDNPEQKGLVAYRYNAS